jgi:hypothetical protein
VAGRQQNVKQISSRVYYKRKAIDNVFVIKRAIGMYRVILSVLDPRKYEYLKDYSLDFKHAYMSTIYEHFQHFL